MKTLFAKESMDSADVTKEKIFFYALQNISGARFDVLEKLQTQFGSWESAWHAPAQDVSRVLTSSFAATLCRLRAEYDYGAAWHVFEKRGISLISRDDDEYPPVLREIPYAPFGIYVRGSSAALSGACVAIVGTRKCSLYGRTVAEQIATDLARAGATIVSGLAFGIDAAAHKGCLAGGGKTLAVLGSGVASVYPAAHARLAEEIIACGGAIVSEYPPDMTPMKHRFIERNRIVSGLSRAIVVVEAPARSGSLATARFAIDQNRDVYVVPGQTTAKSFEGSHVLLKQGAQLVTSAADIIAQYDDLTVATADLAQITFTSPEEEKVFTCIAESDHPISAQEITGILSLDAAEINAHLTMLIMSGILKESNGLFFRRD